MIESYSIQLGLLLFFFNGSWLISVNAKKQRFFPKNCEFFEGAPINENKMKLSLSFVSIHYYLSRAKCFCLKRLIKKITSLLIQI